MTEKKTKQVAKSGNGTRTTPAKRPSPARRTPASGPSRKTATPAVDLKRSIDEMYDQIALVHGVLEEICERQEALAAWQMEFSKRVIMLDEAQWRALEDLAGTHFGHPMQRMRGEKHTPDYSANDSLKDASEYMDSMNEDLARRRRERSQKTTKRQRRVGGLGEESSEAADTRPESILVLPSKPDVH